MHAFSMHKYGFNIYIYKFSLMTYHTKVSLVIFKLNTICGEDFLENEKISVTYLWSR